MKNQFKSITAFLLVILFMASCDEGTTEYDIPSTYDFENVSYTGQTQRLAMLTELANYMKTANTSGVSLDADRMKAMFRNDAANAGFVGSYDASKQLKDKTLESVQASFEIYMDSMEVASLSTVAAANGQAGVSVSNDGTKQYLLNDKGIEYTQIIEKGLMGACFYYQATAVYFGDDKMNVDNVTVEPGVGTAMEHHWDEAFGYLGVPTNFPVSTDGIVFWGKYTNLVNDVLGTNQKLMDALIKGRAAISNNDLDTRDEAITEARIEWEKVVAGTAMHYINVGLANENDFAIRAHALSEAVAFIYGLQFNPEKSLTNAQVNDLLIGIGGSADFTEMNLYNTTNADLETVKSTLAGYMNWGAATADAL